MGGLILVVEDDEAILLAACRGLEEAGFQTLAARTGREAFELLARLRPDAILIDLLMRDRQGWDFLEEKAKVPDLASIPAVLMSGLRVGPQEARSDGFDFQPTPARLEDLVRLVERQLSQISRHPLSR